MIPHGIMDPFCDRLSFLPLTTLVQLLRVDSTWQEWVSFELRRGIPSMAGYAWKLRQAALYEEQWQVVKRRLVPRPMNPLMSHDDFFEGFVLPLMKEADSVCFIEHHYRYHLQFDQLPPIWFPLDMDHDWMKWFMDHLCLSHITHLVLENRNSLYSLNVPIEDTDITHLSVMWLDPLQSLEGIQHLTVTYWSGELDVEALPIESLTIHLWEGTLNQLETVRHRCREHGVALDIATVEPLRP